MLSTAAASSSRLRSRRCRDVEKEGQELGSVVDLGSATAAANAAAANAAYDAKSEHSSSGRDSLHLIINKE